MFFKFFWSQKEVYWSLQSGKYLLSESFNQFTVFFSSQRLRFLEWVCFSFCAMASASADQNLACWDHLPKCPVLMTRPGRKCQVNPTKWRITKPVASLVASSPCLKTRSLPTEWQSWRRLHLKERMETSWNMKWSRSGPAIWQTFQLSFKATDNIEHGTCTFANKQLASCFSALGHLWRN